MTGTSKIKTIESVDLLLDGFSQCLKGQRDGGFLEASDSIVDGRTKLRFATEQLRCTLEVWPRLHPSRKLLQAKDEVVGKSVLLLCPHLPDALAADLRSADINHADLNGRLFIKTPSFLLDREPKRNIYRNPGATLNPFTLKSSRIVRLLLSHRTQQWTQEELESRTGISRAAISLTLGDLIGRELVEQTRPGSRHQAALDRMRDFHRLLDEGGAEDGLAEIGARGAAAGRGRRRGGVVRGAEGAGRRRHAVEARRAGGRLHRLGRAVLDHGAGAAPI